MRDFDRYRRVHAARKQHRCTMCRGTIDEGESYIYISGRWDGSFYVHKYHLFCYRHILGTEPADSEVAPYVVFDNWLWTHWKDWGLAAEFDVLQCWTAGCRVGGEDWGRSWRLNRLATRKVELYEGSLLDKGKMLEDLRMRKLELLDSKPRDLVEW